MYHDGWNLSPNAGAGATSAHFCKALSNGLNGAHFGTRAQLIEPAKLLQRSHLRVGEQAVEPIWLLKR